MTNKQEKPVCLRCSGPMEKGFVSDTVGHITIAGFWAKGRRSRLVKRSDTKLSIPILDKAFPPEDEDARQTFEIEAYRCELCGYLELYANKLTYWSYKNFKK